MSVSSDAPGTVTPLPRTRSCGDSQTVEIKRQMNTVQQTGQNNPEKQSPLLHHKAKESAASQQLQRETDQLGVDEDGYLSMRNIQALLSSSERDYEYVSVVHQQLSLSDDDSDYEKAFPPARATCNNLEDVRNKQPQTSTAEEDEYITMKAQNDRSSVASNWSDSDEYEPIQFVDDEDVKSETCLQQWTNNKNRSLVPPVPPPPYSARRATAPQSTREALQETRAPLLPPPSTSTMAASACVILLDAFIEDRAPVPPPRTKRKRRTTSSLN